MITSSSGGGVIVDILVQDEFDPIIELQSKPDRGVAAAQLNR